MTRYFAFLAILAAACGDDSKMCGTGTMDMGGVCTPSPQCGQGTVDDGTGTCIPDGTILCTDGTMFDPAKGKCVVDPNDCQGDTVLIGDRCVDPTKGITADIEEGPEPNGLGLLGEASGGIPAGTITLKDVGVQPGFIIHGTINPTRIVAGQPAPDIDAYVVSVTAPTLLHVTADGVHGLAAAFVSAAVVAQTDPLAAWERLGVNLTGDTSKRQLFLPSAGTYVIGIADTRSLFLTGGAAGGPTADYYVTIDQLATPTPTALVLDTNKSVIKTGTIGDEVQLYSVALGTGANDIQLAMPQTQVASSVVAQVNGSFRALANETTGEQPAHLILGGLATGDASVLVVDDFFHYGLNPAPFTLTVHAH